MKKVTGPLVSTIYFVEGTNDVASEALMTLQTSLCHHSSYHGGKEKKFFRAANGHTRTIQCKEDECNKAVIASTRSMVKCSAQKLLDLFPCCFQGLSCRSSAP